MERGRTNAKVPHALGPRGCRSLSRRRRIAVAVAATAGALPLSACSSGYPSTLNPKGPGASRIAGLWWFMFGVSAAVVLLVGVLLLVAVVVPRRRERRIGAGAPVPTWAKRLVIGGGVVFPVIVLSVLWAITLHDSNALSSPPSPEAFTVDVIGHQWWWEVRYPSQGILTANDIYVPVGVPVRIVLTSVDVNHSFWVPQLMGKTDLIPGRTNAMWIQADHPGVYRGQCAEYCGVQHANMIFFVVAQPRADFETWVARERTPASLLPGATVAPGLSVFLDSACVACHTIRGTPAHGTFGPDLTHFGSRLTIGAGTVANIPGDLGGWIINSQTIKPGNKMPPIQLSPQDLKSLIAYLESLK